jgi:predicted DNA-binding protein
MDMSGKNFLEQFHKKASRPTVEETHRRATFLIENELLERLNRLASDRPRGFKTAVVNEGIRRVLDEIEGNK